MKWHESKKDQRKQLEDHREHIVQEAELAQRRKDFKGAFRFYLQAAEISKDLAEGDQEQIYLATARNMEREVRVETKKHEMSLQEKIRATILDLGTKFTRLQIVEIAEKCGLQDNSVIVTAVEDMIARGQIAAEYFKTTQAVAFNQQANIQEKNKFVAELEKAFSTWSIDDKKL